MFKVFTFISLFRNVSVRMHDGCYILVNCYFLCKILSPYFYFVCVDCVSFKLLLFHFLFCFIVYGWFKCGLFQFYFFIEFKEIYGF